MPTPLLFVIVCWYLAFSATAFLAFYLDKRRAVRNQWRIPEARLHLLELLGGFPGALLASHLLRHKNRKFAYQLILSAIVLLHLIAWVCYLLPRFQ